MFVDKIISCCDCKKKFNFTIGEQAFFASKALLNQPKRCQNCRLELRRRRSNPGMTITESPCASCGSLAKVPFAPKGHSPVYCVTCFAILRQSTAS